MAQVSNGKTKITDNAQHRKNRVKLTAALIVGLVIVAGIFYFASASIRSAEEELNESIAKELHSMSYSRASEINTWLRAITEQVSRFTNSDTIKFFAEEVDRSPNDVVVMLNGSDQSSEDRITVEIVQRTLADFVHYSDFLFGAMSTTRGDIYLASEQGQSLLSEPLKALAREASESARPVIGPIMVSPTKGLYFSLFLPITSSADQDRVASVLYLTKAIGPKLNELLSLGTYSGKGYNVNLLQKSGNDVQNVYFTNTSIKNIPTVGLFNEAGHITFNVRQSSDSFNPNQVYSTGSQVQGVDWWVVWEVDYNSAREGLNMKRRTIYLIASLGSLAILLFIGSVWWWMVGHERSRMLSKVQELNLLIGDQKRLLDSINSNISDMISLTDTKGTFIYINRAFALAVGREARDIPGLDTAAVFGFRTAEGLTKEDKLILEDGQPRTMENFRIWLQDNLHYFQISKTALVDSKNNISGIVSVYRDRTSMVLAEEKYRRVNRETIDALVGAIEQNDPFLGGHSRIMTAVVRLLTNDMKNTEELSGDEVDTILTAAPLSQIGKMYLPRDLLTKPGALTEEEKKVVEQHVEFTKDILKNVEFELPVVEAIYEMNERLDGKGYPRGLKNEEIILPARVLAVANAFTAMARPRSYRKAMDVHTVITTLEDQKGSYDQHIVERLRACLSTSEGQAVVKMAAELQAV